MPEFIDLMRNSIGGRRSDPIMALVAKFYDSETVSLHQPVFVEGERDYVLQSIDSNLSPTVGALVTKFEDRQTNVIGADRAVAAVNGTPALFRLDI